MESHVVNNAMALKEPAVFARLTQNEQAHQEVEHRIQVLDAYHGQVTGVFTGDEVLAGKNPSQGDLSSVLSLNISSRSKESGLQFTETPHSLIAWSVLPYNALPATFKPDMWAHQRGYDQQGESGYPCAC